MISLGKFWGFKTLQLLLLLPLLFYYFALFTYLSGHHGATQKINWAGVDLEFSLSHMVKRITHSSLVEILESMKRSWSWWLRVQCGTEDASCLSQPQLSVPLLIKRTVPYFPICHQSMKKNFFCRSKMLSLVRLCSLDKSLRHNSAAHEKKKISQYGTSQRNRFLRVTKLFFSSWFIFTISQWASTFNLF